MKKPLLLGYVSTKDLGIVTEGDAKALDLINIAFAHVVDGKCVWKALDAEAAIARLRSINPKLKFVLSVGDWSAGGFSEAASTAEGRRLFAETAAEVVGTYQLDGIDIDWEYPGISMAGIKASADDKVNFTFLRLKRISTTSARTRL